MFLVFFFFFFQAEDGIRDWSVTGVQTCALPISLRLSRFDGCSVKRRRRGSASTPTAAVCWNHRESLRGRKSTSPTRSRRSEERRVGKEGRSRWSPYH